MKLFVWVDPTGRELDGPWMLIAIAASLEEAKAIAKTAPLYCWLTDNHGLIEEYRGKDLGEPTRVVELPCAEWHEFPD